MLAAGRKCQAGPCRCHNGLGVALFSQGNFEAALGECLQALRLRPDFAEAHNNAGIVLHSQGEFAEAMAHYDHALLLQPDFAEAHWNRALLRLLHGDFTAGWPEYEWRWKHPGFSRRSFPQPAWDGSPLNGRTILLHCEQGLGDTIQFIRYAALVKQQGEGEGEGEGCKVIVECQPGLVDLLTHVKGIDELVVRGSTLPPYDVHAPLLSLPGIFHSPGSAVPAKVPYLRAQADLVNKWRSELDRLPGTLRVGINWQGTTDLVTARQRSIPLDELARLAQVRGVELISLQKGDGLEELHARVLRGQCPIHEWGSRLDNSSGAFMDTAAVMASLDLVISSDTAIAHLAGALGVPVWLALTAVPNWRWLLELEDSQWYPTMRLFRQTRQGQWSDVFDRIIVELEALARRTP